MKVFLFMIILSTVLFSSAFAQSPLEQYHSGVDAKNVSCNVGYQLIVRSNGMPACVFPESVDALSQRSLVAVILDVVTEAPTNEAETLADANNQFMADFYSLNDKEENLFFSPWSILSAFSVLYEGANGQTADEIASALYLPRDDTKRQDSFESLQQDLNPSGTEYELANANALWIKKGFEIKQDYVNTAKKYYDSKIASAEFPQDEPVIDSWVENQTNGKITDLVKGKTNEMTRLVITNAVYFKGAWKSQFNPNATSTANFTTNSGIVDVPMMFQESGALYAEDDSMQVLKLPYKDDRLSMMILLPKSGQIPKSISSDEIKSWNNMLQHKEVYMYIPKFKLETTYDLGKKMKDLGVKTAFDPNNADLSGIADVSPNNLYIGFATHKAFVDVNEVGTEAAAATAIGIRATSAPANPTIFRADHPFVFLIQDEQSGLVLFMGKLTNPGS